MSDRAGPELTPMSESWHAAHHDAHPGRVGGSVRRLRAITRKEFIQLLRDRRTLALMVGMPLVLLLIFGYGVRLSVSHIGAELVGHDS
ncbi:ABC-2 type transport system permease protein, partial [mine drainage metagenome]